MKIDDKILIYGILLFLLVLLVGFEELSNPIDNDRVLSSPFLKISEDSISCQSGLSKASITCSLDSEAVCYCFNGLAYCGCER